MSLLDPFKEYTVPIFKRMKRDHKPDVISLFQLCTLEFGPIIMAPSITELILESKELQNPESMDFKLLGRIVAIDPAIIEYIFK